jgi:hypothetical protein
LGHGIHGWWEVQPPQQVMVGEDCRAAGRASEPSPQGSRQLFAQAGNPCSCRFALQHLLVGSRFLLQIHALFIPGDVHPPFKKEYILKANNAFNYEVSLVRQFGG